MKTLVYITNYEGNDKVDHLNKILSELNNIDFLIIDVVIYTTEELKLNTFNNLNVLTEIHPKVFSNSPFKSEWQPEPEFIWIFRKDIVNKVGAYDLYIHLEDDVLFTKTNIQTFIDHNTKIGDRYVIGNITYEKDGDEVILPQFHEKYRGIGKVIEINGEKYFIIKNIHQGSFILTNKQLKTLINADHLKPTPKTVGDLNIKCSAVSECYTTNILTKIIPVKEIDEILVEHLSKKYIKLNKNRKSFWYNKFQTLQEIKKTLEKV